MAISIGQRDEDIEGIRGSGRKSSGSGPSRRSRDMARDALAHVQNPLAASSGKRSSRQLVLTLHMSEHVGKLGPTPYGSQPLVGHEQRITAEARGRCALEQRNGILGGARGERPGARGRRGLQGRGSQTRRWPESRQRRRPIVLREARAARQSSAGVSAATWARDSPGNPVPRSHAREQRRRSRPPTVLPPGSPERPRTPAASIAYESPTS